MTTPFKRVLVRTAASAGLLIASVIPLGDLSGAFTALAATLGDPFGLLAARSPGARGDGVLQSTKPDRAAAVPHERVLAQVRDRPTPPFAIPDTGISNIMVPDLPALGPVASGTSASPFTVASNPGFGAFPGFPFSPFSPFATTPPATNAGGSGGVPGGAGGSVPPVTAPGDGALPPTPDLPGDSAGNPVVDVPGSPGGVAGNPVVDVPGSPAVPPGDPVVEGLAPPPAIILAGDPPVPPPIPPTLPTLGPGADLDPGPPAIVPVPPGLTPPLIPPPDAPGPVPVPEAPSAAMLLLGLIAMGAVRRGSKRLL